MYKIYLKIEIIFKIISIKEIEFLNRSKQLLTLYYSKESGLQNFKGDNYEYKKL